MPEMFSSTPIWTWPAGAVILFLAVKVLWPVISQSMKSTLFRGEVGDGLLTAAIARAEKAEARADAAETRLDLAQITLAEVKAELIVLNYKLTTANERIQVLTEQIAELRGKPI